MNFPMLGSEECRPDGRHSYSRGKWKKAKQQRIAEDTSSSISSCNVNCQTIRAIKYRFGSSHSAFPSERKDPYIFAYEKRARLFSSFFWMHTSNSIVSILHSSTTIQQTIYDFIVIIYRAPIRNEFNGIEVSGWSIVTAFTLHSKVAISQSDQRCQEANYSLFSYSSWHKSSKKSEYLDFTVQANVRYLTKIEGVRFH